MRNRWSPISSHQFQQPAAGCSFHNPAMEPGAEDRPPQEDTPTHAAENDTQSAEKAAGGWRPQLRNNKSLSFPLSSATRPWRTGKEKKRTECLSSLTFPRFAHTNGVKAGRWERRAQTSLPVHSCTTSESGAVSRSSRGTRAAAINMRRSSQGPLLLLLLPPKQRRCRRDQKSSTIPPTDLYIQFSHPTPFSFFFFFLVLPFPPGWERWNR